MAAGPYWNVQRVDSFARGRIMNYLRRMGVTTANPFHTTSSIEKSSHGIPVASQRGGEVQQQNNAPWLSPEEEISSARISTVLYTATLHLPLPSPHGSYMAEGVGETIKDAEILAAMHAERVCDALGVPLFRLPSMQQKYAENVRRREQRYAPLPGEAVKPEGTAVPPPLRMVSAATEKSLVEAATERKRNTKGGERGGGSAMENPESAEWGGRGNLNETAMPDRVSVKEWSSESLSSAHQKKTEKDLEGEPTGLHSTTNTPGDGRKDSASTAASFVADPIAFSSLFSPLVTEAEIIVERTTRPDGRGRACGGGIKSTNASSERSGTTEKGSRFSTAAAAAAATTTEYPPYTTPSFSSMEPEVTHEKRSSQEHTETPQRSTRWNPPGTTTSPAGEAEEEGVPSPSLPSTTTTTTSSSFTTTTAVAESTPVKEGPPSPPTTVSGKTGHRLVVPKSPVVAVAEEAEWVLDYRSAVCYPWSLSSSPRGGYRGTTTYEDLLTTTTTATAASSAGYYAPFDPTESGRWQMVNVLSSRRSVYAEDAIGFPCVLDPGAMERVKDFFLQRATLSAEAAAVAGGGGATNAAMQWDAEGGESKMAWLPPLLPSSLKKWEEAFVLTHVVLPGSATRMYVAELDLQLSLPLPFRASRMEDEITIVSPTTPTAAAARVRGDGCGGTAAAGPSSTRVSVMAKGKANQKEVAKQLAAMHAELLLDALGLPLFPRDAARQARHAKAAAAYGRAWVLGNPDQEGHIESTATVSDGDLSSSSSSSSWLQSTTPLPLPLKQQLGCGEEVWIEPGWKGSNGSSHHTSAGAAASSSSAYVRTEEERIVVAHNTLNFFCSDAVEVYPPSDLLEEAESLLARWQREVVHSPYPQVYLLTKMGDFFRAATLTPVPRAFGVRGGIAVARTPAMAVSLCALHAIDSLCALGIPVCTKPAEQAAFLRRRRVMGRITPEEWIGWWGRGEDGEDVIVGSGGSGSSPAAAASLEPATVYEPSMARLVYDGLRMQPPPPSSTSQQEEKEKEAIADGRKGSNETSSTSTTGSVDSEKAHQEEWVQKCNGGGEDPSSMSPSSLAGVWGWKYLLRALDNHHHHQQQKQQRAAASGVGSSGGACRGLLRPPYLPAYLMEGSQPRRLPQSTDLRDILQISITRDVEEYGKGCTEEELIHIGNEVKVCVHNYLRHQYALREAERLEAQQRQTAAGASSSSSTTTTGKKKKKKKASGNAEVSLSPAATTTTSSTPSPTTTDAASCPTPVSPEEKDGIHGWDARTPPLLVPSVCITGYGRTGASVHNIAFLRLLPPFVPSKKTTRLSSSSSSSFGSRTGGGGNDTSQRKLQKDTADEKEQVIRKGEEEEEKISPRPFSSSAGVRVETSLLPPLTSPSCFANLSTTTTTSTFTSSTISYVPLAVGFSLKKKDAERACYVHAARLLYEVYGEDVLARYRAGLPRLSVVGSFDTLKEKCFKDCRRTSPAPAAASSSTPPPSVEHPCLPPPRPLIHTTMKNFIDTGRYMTVQKTKRSPF